MYQRMKKIRVGIFFLLFLIVSLVAIGTATKAAFHSPTEEKDNLFQIGYLETKISEEFVSPTTISPNETIPKKVRIENTGTVPQVIRLMVLPVIQKKIPDGSTINELYAGQLGKEVLLESLDVVNWADGEDGYYYYLGVVNPGSTTSDLFTGVRLDDSLPYQYQDSTFTLQLKVEAATKETYRMAWWGSDQTPSSAPYFTIDTALNKTK